MKKSILSILAIAFTVLTFNAQSKEGYIKYSIDMSSENTEMQMGLAMMSGSKMEISFKGEDSRMKMNMGSFMTIETVTKNNNDVLLLISGMMIGSTAVKTTKTELEASEGTPEMSVEFESETKEILGYLCKKAVVSSGENKGLIFWYTEKMDMPDNQMLNANGLVPGVILEFETIDGEMNMAFTAIDVKKEIGDSITFSLAIPEGFDEKTFEEFSKMSGGGF
ncbi:MAG: hypothetical protein PSN34_15900 [Urechidicola sp.]|nr:hypothetical protein [Urechidicola sp.]